MYFLECFDFVYSDDFLAPIERIYDFLVGNIGAFPGKSAVFMRYSPVRNDRRPLNSFHRMIRAIPQHGCLLHFVEQMIKILGALFIKLF